MGAYRAKLISTSALAMAGALVATQAKPQETGRPFLTFRFAQSLELSDNPDLIANPTGTTLSSRTALGFSLSSENLVQKLQLDGGLDLLYELATSSDDPFDDGFRDPFVRLSYHRESATAELDLTAFYSKTNVGDLRLITDPDRGDIILDEGDVERTRYTLGFETGKGEPIGFQLDSSYQRRVYTDTTDPDLVDDEFMDARARLRFAIDQATNVSLIAKYENDQELEGGDYERRTQGFGIGLDREIDAATTVRFDLTADQIDTTRSGVLEETEGYSALLGLTREDQRGTYSITLDSDLENIGKRNTLRFERQFDIPDGALGFHVGITNNDTSDLNAIFGANYRREMDDSTLTARISQSVQQDISSDDEYRDRVVFVGFDKEINRVSSWGTSFTYAESDNLTDGTDTTRTDFSLSYSHNLTADWEVVSGYTYEESRSSTDDDRKANTLFLTLRRDFAVRP